ncbi:MAG: sporulation transcriptional regulator SpoIIID [Firmicutes bacterium]|nr:sporulation transcriptional regulator SpoIIID [Bacillota bacterium]
MHTNITNRVIQLADHVIATGDTVRAAAEKFGISKSTVHKDLSDRLFYIDRAKYAKVRSVLDKNLSERHIRGGIATKRKYRLKKQRVRTENTNERG